METDNKTNHYHCPNWYHLWTRGACLATPTCLSADFVSQTNFLDEVILVALSAVL
jgi:hypothetical protein